MAVATLPAPAGAQVSGATADPVAPTTATQVVYGPGEMDSSEVVLSGPTPAPPTPDGTPAAGATGWSTTVDLVAGTQMVGLTWDADASAPDGTIALRSRQAGTWTAWQSIRPDLKDMGEPAERVGTDVVWLGQQGADAVEVRVERGPLVALELMRLHHTPGEPEVVPTPQARTSAGRVAAKPPIRTRSEWGAGPYRCSGGPDVAPALKHIVVHHTAGTNSYTASQVPGILQAIYRLHTNGNGWCDVGYNFLVDKFGTIWQGRTGDMTKPVIGGHSRGFNTGSVGVSLMGQFQPGASGVPASGQPTTAMLDSAARLIAWQASLHGLNPRGTVSVTSLGNDKYPAGRVVSLPVINAHRDNGATACPGDTMMAKMAGLRDAVVWYMAASNPPPEEPPPTDPPPADWTPFPSVEDLVWRQFSDFRRDPGTYDARRWWAVELDAGRTNRNSLVAQLARDPFVEQRTVEPLRLYLTYFGRIPDSAGMRYWWSEVDAGRNLRTISARFSGSPEFKQMYGSLSNADFVRLVYRNVLGRDASSADLSYWTGQINGGKDSRGGVMAHFSKSAEYKTRSKEVVEVILVHEVMLGRAIGAQSHMEWVARVQRDGIAPLIGTLFASSEYANRIG